MQNSPVKCTTLNRQDTSQSALEAVSAPEAVSAAAKSKGTFYDSEMCSFSQDLFGLEVKTIKYFIAWL